MKLVYQYMSIFFNFSPTSSHLHPLQVENCDIVDEDDNGKVRLERVKLVLFEHLNARAMLHRCLTEIL